MTPPLLRRAFRQRSRALPVSFALLALALPALAQQAPAAPAQPAADDPEAARRNAAIADGEGAGDVVTLSPFVVTTEKDAGYFAQNTLAGSRLKMNVSDLGAAISVVTKQQMEDTGSIDVNDVFRYEINTEGSGTYTPSTPAFRNDGPLDVNAGGTQGNAVSSFTNATANRVRGLGVPSSAVNYYPSIGQIPMDSYNIQSVEISRGPNSMIFGLGSPAGIVNQTTAQAALNTNSYRVQLRTDRYGSYRGSFSFNRALIKDKLSIYGAAVYDNREFDRKPSLDLTKRQYAAFTFKPFAKTTIRGNVENYRNDNRRPNTLTPRDFVTQWNLAGQPAYDPLTRQIRLGNGNLAGVNIINAASPYASEARNFVRGLSNYNPALRGGAPAGQAVSDTNFTTYNGISLFGDAATTNSVGFIASSNTRSTNALFVPGITWVNQARSIMQIADGQLVSWFRPLSAQRSLPGWSTPPAANPAQTPTEAAIWANPTWADIYNRSYASSQGWTGIGNGIIGYKYPGVTDKSIYDWEKVNINQMNFGQDLNQNYNLELEQEILPNLYLNAGWFRQDFISKTNYTVAQLNTSTLYVDVNKNLPDGTPNPYFGKPYVEDTDPDRYVNASLDDHYRAMLAYTPDFSRNQGWTKWFGRHQILGMYSRDENMSSSIRQRINYIDSTSFDGKLRFLNNQNNNADGTPTGWNFQSTSLRRTFYLARPGDPNGTVTTSSGEWDHLAYTGDIKVYDYNTSAFKTVNVSTVFNDFDAGTGRSQRILDSMSAGLTSYLWNERLVTTFGVRKDEYRARSTNTGLPALTDANGNVLAPAITNPQKWVNGVFQREFLFNRWARWNEFSGTTRTAGGVLRPFRNWDGIEQRANNGSLFWQFVRDFGVSYNKSDNFNPPGSAEGDGFGNPLPKPTGEGEDYGFQFSLFNNKLFARVNWFEASNQFERVSPTTTVGRLEGNIDTTLFRNWARTIAMINMGMDPRVAGFGEGLTTTQENAIQDAAEVIWKQPYDYYTSLPFGRGGTRSAASKGMEAEINYNPSRNWTMKFTFGKQDTKYTGVLKEFNAWYEFRNPIWQAAKAADYLLPQYQGLLTYTSAGGRAVDLTNFWSSYGYTSEVRLDDPFGNTNVANYYNINVTPQVSLARDLEGQSAPGQRKYRWSFLTSYNFTQGRLKGWFAGGGQRWEDKAVIGYYGRSSGANGTQLDVSDTTRPIYDDANSYTDVWVGYQRPIWHDKIKMKVQLNVVNLFENGGLQTVSVNYDGSPYAYRIVDPRYISLTTTFDF